MFSNSMIPGVGNPSSEIPARTPAVSSRISRSPVLAIVLALVNAVAIWGQAGWALDHVVPAEISGRSAIAMALMFACAIELVGVYLAQMADQALQAKLPSGGLRFGSYGVGLLAGAMNFSHFGSHGLAASLAFGFLSASSPFLWGIWAKLRHRISDPDGTRRGVRLSPARKVWHPILSVRVIRFAAWEGISDEDDAVRSWSLMRDANQPTSPAPSDPVTIGRTAIQMRQTSGASWGDIAGTLGISERHLLNCRKAAESAESAGESS